jgi:GT2 family glycosyltransferase
LKYNQRIATLLTVHNRKEKTIVCLSALFACPLPKNYQMDVYLVDDGSTDGTSIAIKEKFPQVNIIQGSGNLFWNRGMHLAWTTAAKTKDYYYYLWLNDDTILYPNAILELIACSENESNQKIIVGSTCAVNDSHKITYGGRLFDKRLVKPSGQIQSCDYFNGNVALIPQQVYSIVGTNDSIFHHALGDFDYGLRAGKLGVRSVVAPHVLGQCDGHGRFEKWNDPQTPMWQRIQLLYTPLGHHPIESFIYEKRHNGIILACFRFFTNHLRVILPKLWM